MISDEDACGQLFFNPLTARYTPEWRGSALPLASVGTIYRTHNTSNDALNSELLNKFSKGFIFFLLIYLGFINQQKAFDKPTTLFNVHVNTICNVRVPNPIHFDTYYTQ